jgi:hypothetical protein
MVRPPHHASFHQKLMDLHKAAERLLNLSRAGRPKYHVRCGGRLHDSALGAIYLAEVDAIEGPCILKTIDLKDQNIWAVTRNNKRTTIRGLNLHNVDFLSSSKTEATDFKNTWASTLPEDALIGKVAFLNGGALNRDGATRLALCNEYMNEALVGLTVSENFVKFPHFVKTYDCWIQDATGFILQDHAGHALGNSICEMTLPEFKSAVVQVLVALAVAEQRVHLKHHDVHLDNVFVTRLKDSDALRTTEHWTYQLHWPADGAPITLKHHGILVRLGDFGLSSATDPRTRVRYERADYPLLDGAEFEWGSWNGNLQACKSYDIATFLSKFFLDQELELCPQEHAKWAQSLYKALLSMAPDIQCSLIGRPHRGREGHVSATQFLRHRIFDEFRQQTSATATVLWPEA